MYRVPCMSSGVSVAKAQKALGAIAFELLALQERLTEIERGLPVPTNQEAMLEDEVPPDLATEVSGCIECIRDDYLRQVIEALEQASRVTALDLERDFRERQKRRRRMGESLPRRCVDAAGLLSRPFTGPVLGDARASR